jgi:Bacterial Ig domain
VIARFPLRIAFLTILSLWSLAGGVANAQTCHAETPRYSLREDTVNWQMTIVKGHSCIRGLRFGNVEFDELKLVSPPQFGEVVLQGSGFIYSPKAHFRGRDAFSLMVVGVIDGRRGSSTIQVTVSDAGSDTSGMNSPRDITPPIVAFTNPSEGATVSGSVALAATASDDVGVASVQFFLAGKNIGSAVTSPPYTNVWDTRNIADGIYTLYAVAQDTSGNYGTSGIHVTVQNK